MKQRLLVILLAAVCGLGALASAAQTRSSAELTIVYPGPQAKLPALSKSFAFGAAPPGADVSVNGVPALTSPAGGWIAYVPFSRGEFTLHVAAHVNGQLITADRVVTVATAPATTPASPARVDTAVSTDPQDDVVVEPGDTVHLFIKASTGARVRASLTGIAAGVPLVETASEALEPSEQARVLGDAVSGFGTISGIYRGEVRVPVASSPSKTPVSYTVTARDGSSVTAVSKGTVSVASPSSRMVGVVTVVDRARDIDARPYGIVESAPDGGWLFYPPPGTPFSITGSDGGYYRVALGANDEGWIAKKSLALAALGTPAPRAQVEDVIVRDQGRATAITIHLSARVPFRVEESVDGPSLRVRIYGANAGTDFVRYGSDHSSVRSVIWDQLSEGVAAVSISLRQRALWGYHAGWNGNDIKLLVKKPPPFARAPAHAVAGLMVVVDPGHSPDTGAIGPLGTQERDINLAISKQLAAHLRALGARVALTRSSNVPVGLYARTDLAARLGADVLVSVHNNALPDGANPYNHHGFSVYYYQPQSLDLARAIHQAYVRDSGLPDYGLYYDNLALARPTEEPAVLTESAFVMWPPEEMQLRSASFQAKLGATIADGIEHWAQSMRHLESGK